MIDAANLAASFVSGLNNKSGGGFVKASVVRGPDGAGAFTLRLDGGREVSVLVEEGDAKAAMAPGQNVLINLSNGKILVPDAAQPAQTQKAQTPPPAGLPQQPAQPGLSAEADVFIAGEVSKQISGSVESLFLRSLPAELIEKIVRERGGIDADALRALDAVLRGRSLTADTSSPLQLERLEQWLRLALDNPELAEDLADRIPVLGAREILDKFLQLQRLGGNFLPNGLLRQLLAESFFLGNDMGALQNAGPDAGGVFGNTANSELLKELFAKAFSAAPAALLDLVGRIDSSEINANSVKLPPEEARRLVSELVNRLPSQTTGKPELVHDMKQLPPRIAEAAGVPYKEPPNPNIIQNRAESPAGTVPNKNDSFTNATPNRVDTPAGTVPNKNDSFTSTTPNRVDTPAGTVPNKNESFANAIPNRVDTPASIVPNKNESFANAIPTRVDTSASIVPNKNESFTNAIPNKVDAPAGTVPNRNDSFTNAMPNRADTPVGIVPNRNESFVNAIPNRVDTPAGTVPNKSESFTNAIPNRADTSAGTVPNRNDSFTNAIPNRVDTPASIVPNRNDSFTNAIPNRADTPAHIMPNKTESFTANIIPGRANPVSAHTISNRANTSANIIPNKTEPPAYITSNGLESSHQTLKNGMPLEPSREARYPVPRNVCERIESAPSFNIPAEDKNAVFSQIAAARETVRQTVDGSASTGNRHTAAQPSRQANDISVIPPKNTVDEAAVRQAINNNINTNDKHAAAPDLLIRAGERLLASADNLRAEFQEAFASLDLQSRVFPSDVSGGAEPAAVKQSLDALRLETLLNTSGALRNIFSIVDELRGVAGLFSGNLPEMASAEKLLMRAAEDLARQARQTCGEIIDRLNDILRELNRMQQDSSSVGGVLAARQSPAEIVRSAALTAAGGLESLNLLASAVRGQQLEQQVIALPVKIGEEWTEVQVKIIKERKGKGKKEKKAGDGHVSVYLNVAPSTLGEVTAHLDYHPPASLKLSLQFGKPEAAKWFRERAAALREALSAAGLPGAALEFHTKRRPTSAQQAGTGADAAESADNRAVIATGVNGGKGKVDFRA